MPDNKIVFVSGANRGIGFEFVKQLSDRGDTVIGGYREESRSQDLLNMARNNRLVRVAKIDITDDGALKNLAEFIKDKFGKLDLAISNAGVNLKYDATLAEITGDDLMENFRVNVIGTFNVAQMLRPFLAKGKNPLLVNITSGMGSISRSSGGATAYRISKAGVNMLTKNQSVEFREDGIAVIALHPGWVRTDMGGPSATLSAEEAVAQMLQVIDGISSGDSGSFLSYAGVKLDY